MDALDHPEFYKPEMRRFAEELLAAGYDKIRDTIRHVDEGEYVGWAVFDDGAGQVFLYAFSDVDKCYGTYKFEEGGLTHRKALKKFDDEELKEIRTTIVATLL